MTGSLWSVSTTRICSPSGIPIEAAPVGPFPAVVERVGEELQLVSAPVERSRPGEQVVAIGSLQERCVGR